MNNNTEIDSKWSEDDQEALVLVKHDLNQLVFKDNWERTGLYSFLNRILVVFQQGAVLTVYEEVSGNENGRSKFERRFTTYNDPLHVGDFRDHLAELETQTFLGSDGVREPRIAGHLIDIYKTRYKLHVTLVNRTEDYVKGVNRTKMKFTPYPLTNSSYLHIINRLLSEKHIYQDNFFNDLGVGKFWEKRLEDGIKAQCKKTEPSSVVGYSQAGYDGGLVEEIRDVIIENIHKSVHKSALLDIWSEKAPANIAYFVRTHTLSGIKSRFDLFDYQVRMVIPPTQAAAFREALTEISETVNLDKPNWSLDGRELDHFPDKDYAGRFLAKLKEDGGIESILEILQKPYSDHTRCFADVVFSSGFTNIRRLTFASKYGMVRIDHRYEDSPVVTEDKVKSAAMFYIFSLMSPKATEITGKYCTFTRPIPVNNAPWLAVLHFGEFVDEYERDHTNWLRFRHFYHDITTPQGRMVRRTLAQCYYKRVEQITKDEMFGIFTAEKDFGPHEIAEALNFPFDTLARYFPFHKLIVGVHLPGSERPESSQQLIVDTKLFSEIGLHELIVKLVPNPYFTNLINTDQEELNQSARQLFNVFRTGLIYLGVELEIFNNGRRKLV